MSAVEYTREYEEWLQSVIPHPLVPDDLAYKHELMSDRDDPFAFFRATYHLWVKRWAADAGELADAPRVLAIGDIHLENFGTWRDADGRLCWGVNDFDECDDLPWTHDLVRLAASVRFAKRGGQLDVKLGKACDLILSGYCDTLNANGMPFVLEEHHADLRAMAMAADREPVQFWDKMKKLLNLPPADLPDDARTVLAVDRPKGLSDVAFRPRPKAGVGSLGRPRYVALAEWLGGWVCREAKATAPPATAWGLGTSATCRTAVTAAGAIRSPDPFYRQAGGWVVRRLAPRASKIELDLLTEVDVDRLLTAMGAEVANVHLGTPLAGDAILADLERRPDGWLREAAKQLADGIEADREEWLQANE